MSNILIVDDEADMRFAVRMLLERSGHSVKEADSGDAALASLDDSRPDAVLLDMRLPGMDGIQILQKLREKEKDLPIIMVTGYGNTELAQQAIQMGADHYLSKPFHNKELLDVIKQVLEKRGVPVTETSAPSAAAEILPEETSEFKVQRSPRVKVFAGIAVAVLVLAGWHLNRPRDEYSVPYSNPAGLAFMENQLWVADWFSQAIYLHEVRKRDLPLKKTFYLPDVHLTGMAVTANAVYTADAWAHVLRKHRLDDHLSIVFTVPSPGSSPCSLFWDGKYLWSCDLSTGKIYQHQADDRLTVVASFTSPGKAPVGFFKDDRYAWSMDAKTRSIYERRLDRDLSIIGAYQLPEWGEGAAPLASFTWRDKDLWFTRTGKGLIFRRSKKLLHPATEPLAGPPSRSGGEVKS